MSAVRIDPRAGADAFLPKPFELHEVEAVVSRLVPVTPNRAG
jgi:hypothetical protein